MCGALGRRWLAAAARPLCPVSSSSETISRTSTSSPADRGEATSPSSTRTSTGARTWSDSETGSKRADGPSRSTWSTWAPRSALLRHPLREHRGRIVHGARSAAESEARRPGIFAISIHKTVLGPRGIHSYDEFLKQHNARLIGRVGHTILVYEIR